MSYPPRITEPRERDAETVAELDARVGVPVIGVAKTAFRTATRAVAAHRGNGATRPLFITAAGLSVEAGRRSGYRDGGTTPDTPRAAPC